MIAAQAARRIDVPCLQEGPIANSARSFTEAAAALGRAPAAAATRAWCVPYLFESTERIFASGAEPVGALNRALLDLARALREMGGTLASLGRELDWAGAVDDESDVLRATGEHYGKLFQAFSKASYWDEPLRLLRERLDRNGIALTRFAGKDVLDAGCGGGRYTVAWRLLGARRVTGIDASAIGIADARRRVVAAGFDGVVFQRCDVLALPFAEDSFDVVFSNGVLHHTTAWEKGVSEIVRVLRPGGFGWLYLIESPGGFFWDVIEILRLALKDDPPSIAREALRLLRLPANRIFYMLDHVQVPINVRLTPRQVESGLRRAGAVKIRRLTRGTDFDRIEHIARGEPFAQVHYGVGENRYEFSKA